MSEMESMIEQLQSEKAELSQESARDDRKQIARLISDSDMSITNLGCYVIMTALGAFLEVLNSKGSH